MNAMRCQLFTWIMLVGISFAIQHNDQTFIGVPTLILDNLQLTLSTRLLLDLESQMGKTLHGYLGWLPENSNLSYTSCTDGKVPPETICFKYGHRMVLTIQSEKSKCDNEYCRPTFCHRIEWNYHLSGSMDCFLLGDDYWFGGGARISQRWPLQNDSRPWHAYITGDPAHHPNGGILENLWITSSGFIIFIDRDVPLFLNFNESGNGKLCLSTSLKKHPYHSNDYKNKKLSYTVCSSLNIKEAYIYAIKRWLGSPLDVPDERMIKEPIWSTWARYKSEINHDKVMNFAKEIRSNDFPSSQMEIDDKWEICYGDLEFDTKKFPNPKNLIQNLKALSLRTTLWVHPFCNIECKTYKTGKKNGFWVKNADGKPVTVKWWDGTAAILDTTNKEAADWFISRLQSLKNKYGIESFKFDAGEISWLAQDFILHDQEARLQPNLYTKYYAEMAYKFGGMVEVRSAWNSQKLPLFFRMYDKDSNWDYGNGLKTLIPTALHFSFMGYPFILPDMVGGNNYGVHNKLPDRELYIRWLQANVLLPTIQFSIAPWEYDNEIKNIAKDMVNMHIYFTPYILHLCQESMQKGIPIIRPLWWLAPEDQIAMNTDSQFLVGEHILVAPVLENGARQRDIYIPEGHWVEAFGKETFEGPMTIYGYSADLDKLPVFVRLCKSNYISKFCDRSNIQHLFQNSF